MPLQHAWGLPAIVSHMGLSIVGQTVPSRVGVEVLVKHLSVTGAQPVIAPNQMTTGSPTTNKDNYEICLHCYVSKVFY